MAGARRGEAGIGDEAVARATGRPWRRWFALLDRWGARSRTHAEIARHLRERHDLGPWWSQTVAIRYEQERGRREVGQRSDRTFGVDVQRTVRTTLARAWAAFTQPRLLGRWRGPGHRLDLRVGGRHRGAEGERGRFLRVEPRRRLAFTLEDPRTGAEGVVEVVFEARTRGRVAIRLAHRRIRTKRERERRRRDWSAAFDALAAHLETGGRGSP